MDQEQIQAERRIKWVYGFLFVSMIAYLFWAMCFSSVARNFYRSPPLWVQTIATTLPALLFVILLLGFRSPYTYVRRHAQQGLLLAAFVTALAWLALSLQVVCTEIALLVFLLAWLGGSYRGWQQVKRGDCWLMKKRGEGDLLPRPWAIQERQHMVEHIQTNKPTAEGLTSAKRDAEIARLVDRFRNGSSTERKQAVTDLEKLGEVEFF